MVPIVSDAGKSQPHPTGVKVAARLTLTTTKPTLTQEPPILSPKESIKLKIDFLDALASLAFKLSLKVSN